MGLSIGKVFGRHGFDIALISRSKKNLDALVAELGESGISSAGFPGDVSDRPSLTAALARAAGHFGGIDVLEFSPSARKTGIEAVPPLEVSPENMQPHIDYYLYGGVAAVQAVLPAMLRAGRGTLLFAGGSSAIDPVPMAGNICPAQAALRSWVLNLRTVLAPRGVHVCNVVIGTTIFPARADGKAHADDIAPLFWEAYTNRDKPERFFPPSLSD